MLVHVSHAIGGAEESAVGAAAAMGPRHTAELIEGGEEITGVGRVHGEVYGTGFRGVEEHLLPGVASVLGAIDATLQN